VAWLFVIYSLVYPAVNAIQQVSLSRIPTFGVPCPTTIFTAGLLLLSAPRSWRLSVVPVIWSVIGGSAASLLSVGADYALPIAGLGLVICSIVQVDGTPRKTAEAQLREQAASAQLGQLAASFARRQNRSADTS
jgi:hypothetical protein